MPQILEKCKKENLDKCTAKDFKDRVTDLLGLERVSQLLGMSDETTNTLTQDLDQLKRKCGSFTVSGSARDFGSCKGTICALDKPFVVTCGTLTANFTPVGAAGGSMNFTGTGGGCTFTGSGSYIIGAPAGDDLFGYSLTFTTSSTTSCGGSATVGLTWNLAPIAPGSNTCS